VSELRHNAPGANPSVRAIFVGASESLTSDQVVDLCRVSRWTIGCGLNRLELHAVGAHARDPGHYPATWPDHCLRTGRRIADLPCERRDACAERNELQTQVAPR
jgi:hypothetical protein